MEKSKFECFADSGVLNLEKVKNLVRGGTGGGGTGGEAGNTGSGSEEENPPPLQ